MVRRKCKESGAAALTRSPPSLKVAFIVEIVAAIFGLTLIIGGLIKDFASGAIWKSILGMASGWPYFLFNLQTRVVMIIGLAFALVCFSRICVWLHSEIMGRRIEFPDDIKPGNVDALNRFVRLIPVILFDSVFIGLGICNILSYTQYTFIPAFEDATADSLLMLLFGPILIGMIIGLGILIALGAILCLLAYCYSGRNFKYVKAYLQSFVI